MNALPPPVGPTTRVNRVVDRLATDEYLVEIAADRVALHLTSAAGVQLSREARLAFALGPSLGEHGSSTPLEPLVAMVDVPEGAETLARELAGRVGRSGLFYESHLADWIVGARPKDELMREPQNTTTVIPNPEGVRDLLESDSETASAALDKQVPHPFGVRNDSDVPSNLQPFVREQLAALERHEVRFAIPYGEARPAELVVAQERAPHGTEDPDAAWTSRLRLHLPELGELEAHIRIGGHLVALSIDAADEGTARLLSTSVEALRERLGARELMLGRIEIGSP